jgi:PAS domain S-box-containing protein
MVQYTLDEIRQLGILDIHPEEDVPWILEEFDRHARKETEKEIDIPVKRKDGSIFWAEVKSSPVTISGKEFVLGSFRDITERRKAEEKVKESEDRFRDLVEHSQSLICTHDLEGRILSANPWAATVLGYSQDELLRMNLRDFIAPEVRYEFVGYLEKIRKHGVAQGMLLVQTRNGERRIWEYKNTLRTEGVTEPVVRGMAQDITERKRGEVEKARLEAQLQQAQKMESVGRLAGGVAHDFNNLLTVITGYSELLLQKIGKESPMHGEVEEIKRAGERASSLTQQLLAFSRKQIIEPKVILLDSMVAETHKMLARLIGENIDLQTITGKSPGTVKVDPGQFQQILMNLAVNARDAMPDGGKIVIETANVDLDEGYCALHPYVKPGRFVMLAVSDTGKGMSEEVKTHIFEPFFTTKEMGSGTGLGLATTYGAVHQAGGSIEVYSEVGIGTTFKIYLPRVEEAVVKPEKNDHPTDLPGGTETVLLVEDEEMVRELGVQILERLGYKVLWGSNGTEALAIAEKYDNRIDLLLTDVVMPGMNGSELATQLVLHHPEMKVLFTSGYTDETITRHGVLDEGVSFIGKPYTLSVLARKVREVLDKV